MRFRWAWRTGRSRWTVAESRPDSWPLPPHFVEHEAPGGIDHAECLALRYAAPPVAGRLERFDALAAKISVRPPRDPAATDIGFDDLRVLQLLQAVTLAELPALAGGDTRLSPSKRGFSIQYRDTTRASGETRGFLHDRTGIYLYVVTGERRCAPWFVPAASGKVSVGENLTEALPPDLVAIDAQLRQARARQVADQRKTFAQTLVEADALSSDDAARAIAEKFGVPYVAVRDIEIAADALATLDARFAVENRVLPLYLRNGLLVVATENPFDRELLQRLRFVTDMSAVMVMASGAQVAERLAKEYSRSTTSPGEGAPELAALLEKVDVLSPDRHNDSVVSDSNLVRLVTRIILDAHEQGASDIHVETNPGTMKTRVRLRKDGVLADYLDLSSSVRAAIISRIKVMSDLDISEHRRPQDGKISFRNFGPADLDLRVAIVPTSEGLEDVVLRLLAAGKPMPVDKLGLTSRNFAEVGRMAAKSFGLFLVCGPTGSGKTTTLHSILGSINTAEHKIWTAEDPIEIHQEGLRQVQVNARIGFTFAAAMRSFLRADPDVIMVGEMRDQETTKIGIEASLTGHLVFSTLHTNSASESIVRLLDLGMDPFNFADALIGVLAQRLVRRLCASCMRRRPATPAELEELALEYDRPVRDGASGAGRLLKEDLNAGDPAMIGEAPGCPACNGSGYRGRLAIHELLSADARIRHDIQSKAPVEEVLQAAVSGGMTTLMQDGILKVLQGQTDLRQVRSACS